MSSGGVMIAPAAIVVAAGAAVVVAAAAAAVLVVQAANAAAEGAVRAVGDYGDLLERQAAAQATAEVNAEVWRAVTADVVEVNARIRLVAERARRAGATVALPSPVSVAGRSGAEVGAAVAAAHRQLCAAQQALHAAAISSARIELPAMPGTAGATRLDREAAAAALLRYKDTLERRLAADAAPPVAVPVAAGRGGPGEAEVRAALATLDPDAAEADQVGVLQAAALVGPGDARAATAYLMALQTRIADVNRRTAGRRVAAIRLAALEEPAVARVEPPEPFSGTAAKLLAVVTGEREMTDELRRESRAAAEWAAETTRQQFVQDTLRSCLADQGYRVEGDFDIEHSTVRLRRDDWYGEHSAEVWLDEEGTVHGRVVRHTPSLDDEARARNVDRCGTFNAHLREFGEIIGAEVEVDPAHVPQYSPRAETDVVYDTTVTNTTQPPLARERRP
ncbi:hypothetical protein [Dactylosporangium sp. CA-139066]|uniref:hypothetical protein n=1 Tax=Dactylosporangium sp. CA-139066 TaxID=3239930 RepID=UPI003D8C253D